jgi:D-alanyl-D-alanine carboxypeptidase
MNGRTSRRLGGMMLAATLVVGLTSGTASATPGRADLRQAMNALADTGVAGVQLRIHDDEGDWTGSAGVRELSGGKVPTNGHFRAGSITKVFVSTVVLQLVDEGAVALDDPVDDYLPEYGLDPRITVRMLLQHTSGLFNYTGDLNADGTFEVGIPWQGQEYVDNLFRRYTPDELIAVALSKPARFEPGTTWRYSNTNYIVIAQLITQLTGTPYDVQVRKRILEPLGLRGTVLPGEWTGIPKPHAHGYFTYHHEGQFRVVDVTRLSPTAAHAAGQIISTTRDLDRFVTALLGGRLLPADLLAEMTTPSPYAPYGLGIELLDAGPRCGGVYLGHYGGIAGYASFMFSTPDRGTRLELSVTLGAADTADPAVAERILTAYNDVLVTALCDNPPADQPVLVEKLAVT